MQVRLSRPVGGREVDITKDDLPIINSAGYHIARYNYDLRGNISEELYLDKHGQPVMVKAGYARRTVTHDPRGQLTEARFFDASDKFLGGWRLNYDAKGKETKRIAIDASGKPISPTASTAHQ